MVDEVNILEKDTPKTVKLSDGKDYEFPVMSLNVLANIQKTMGFKINELPAKLIEDPIENARLVFYAFLKEKYADMTLEKAGELITIKNIGTLNEFLNTLLVG
jgi:hypothetical protein